MKYRQTYQKTDDGWVLKGALALRISRLGRSLGSERLKSSSEGGGS